MGKIFYFSKRDFWKKIFLLLILMSLLGSIQCARLFMASIHDVLPNDMLQLIVAEVINDGDIIQAVKTYRTLESTSKKFKSLLESKIKEELKNRKLDILAGYIENLEVARRDYGQPIFIKQALLEAVKRNDYKALWLMLHQKTICKICIKHDFLNSTALHLAVRKKNLDIVKEILTYKPEINKLDSRDWTALHWAVHLGYLKIVLELLKHKPEIALCKGLIGLTPIHLAFSKGHLEIVKALLAYNPAVLNAAKYGKTPLHCAVFYGHIGGVKELLKHKPDLNKANDNGDTPLHWAVLGRHLGIAKELLKHNPKIDMPNNNGETPLSLARRMGYKEIEEELCKHIYAFDFYVSHLSGNIWGIVAFNETFPVHILL